jgi:hypothetical protein
VIIVYDGGVLSPEKVKKIVVADGGPAGFNSSSRMRLPDG